MLEKGGVGCNFERRKLRRGIGRCQGWGGAGDGGVWHRKTGMSESQAALCCTPEPSWAGLIKIVWRGTMPAFARPSLVLNNCIFKEEISAKITRKSLVPLLSLHRPLSWFNTFGI